MAAVTRLLDVYFHAALPRDVPSKETANLHAIEDELTDRLLDAVKVITRVVPPDHQSLVDVLRLALTTSKTLNVGGKIDKHVLVDQLRQLDGNRALLLYVVEQNCALYIYRYVNEFGAPVVVFEAFETSATCEKVLGAKHALEWNFPGMAVAVPYEVFSDDSFQEYLAAFLEQASIENIKQFSAVTHKAAAPLPEIRDTADPTLITGLLMTMLETLGSQHHPIFLTKHVRDTVSWKTARKPWRRSPFYLALRVFLQRHLYKMLGDLGRLYYKSILVIFLSRLLDDTHLHISHSHSHFLRLKLSRRLSKLEVDRERSSKEWKDAHDVLFYKLRSPLEKSLSSATRYLEAQWEEHKNKTRRRIRFIQGYATGADCVLQLRSSGRHLETILSERLDGSLLHSHSPMDLLKQYEKSQARIKPFVLKATQFIELSAFEEEYVDPACRGLISSFGTHTGLQAVVNLRDSTHGSKGWSEVWKVPLSVAEDTMRISVNAGPDCSKLGTTISQYIDTIKNSYDDYPVLMSKSLLRLMELWVEMDRLCVIIFPLVRDFHPVFEAAMLDVLQLQSLAELERLQAVQMYISVRCRAWSGEGSKTIFDPPAHDSFAVRYYDESEDSGHLIELRRIIEEDAEKARVAKENEWKELSTKHEELSREVAAISCIYITEFDDDGNLIQVHQKGCRKHRLKWEAKQITIDIHEHPLHHSESGARAAIFELACPAAFASYRDATCLILMTFAYPQKAPLDQVPRLREYSSLAIYGNNLKFNVSLSSYTKSHLNSHYRNSKFPVPWEHITRPNGLTLDYFDERSRTWVSMKEEPSFLSYFPIQLSPDSSYRSLRLEPWPSSNRIIASVTRCPLDINIHEWMAWQSLLVGTHSRFFSLLREIGSTNINFSTDSTWVVVSRLIDQVGPASSDSNLRDVYQPFDDVTFCVKLLQQISYRLQAICRNFREAIQMDIMISLLLKIISLTSVAVAHSGAIRLLEVARSISWGWQTSLQSPENYQPQGPSVYAIWASILCKRTLYPKISSEASMDTEALRCFIGSSIALASNLNGEFETLPYNLRNALLQDVIICYRARFQLLKAISADGGAFLAALGDIWPLPKDSQTQFWIDQTIWWAVLAIKPTQNSIQIHVHYHVIYGTLLINGQEMGALPPEYHQWPEILHKFGMRNSQWRPSSLPGCNIVASRPMPYGHWVHLGFREGQLVIRATQGERILEFVRSSIFGGAQVFDLPNVLMENCYHWLDLTTKQLEIRRDDPWKSRPNHWYIDCINRRATRNGATLVDPYSAVFRTIAMNFDFFEYAHQICVYQPRNSGLKVELKRLELDFIVNARGLLQCHQLGAVIVESRLQDIGTWYGLHSKIVVQSSKNKNKLSVLVPIGETTIRKQGEHVAVFVQNQGGYVKFAINDVLGRVECPAEPRLLYSRAFWHASTSHFLPDGLTGRTGLEEAIYYLQLGSHQPWAPLPVTVVDILVTIANLSPQRVYYPTSMRCMETTNWNPEITTTVQDDRLRRLVEKIFGRLKELSLFASISSVGSLPSCPSGDTHLEDRAIARSYVNDSSKNEVETYQSRDLRVRSNERQRVACVSKNLFTWPSKIDTTDHLAKILQNHPIIGGGTRPLDSFKQLSDLLSIDLVIEWGAIAQACLDSTIADRYRLMFLLSPIALASKDVDTTHLIQVLVAFAVLPDFQDKGLQPPPHPSYAHFRYKQTPNVKILMEIMKNAKVPYRSSEQFMSRQAGQFFLAKLNHEKAASACLEEFSRSIMKQWPKRLQLQLEWTSDPPVHLLDHGEALRVITNEYTRLMQNFEFSEYLDKVQLVLHRHSVGDSGNPLAHQNNTETFSSQLPIACLRTYPIRFRGGEMPTLTDLLQKATPSVADPHRSLTANGAIYSGHASLALRTLTNGLTQISTQPTRPFTGVMGPKAVRGTVNKPAVHVKELGDIMSAYRRSASSVKKRYGKELEDSIAALVEHMSTPKQTIGVFNATQLSNQIVASNAGFRDTIERIRDSLQHGDNRARWLRHAGWPRLTAVTLLTELRSTSNVRFGKNTKDMLVNLGLAATQYQRFLRIHDALSSNRQQQLSDEKANPGHKNWKPEDNVDWLLLEIDSDLLLRPEQVDVAKATISPSSGENSVLQLLMGKGKTSCIMPMVALVLADKQHLLRILVPRPLLLQSAQVMQAKLGGLLNRDVMHIPFSRRTRTDIVLMQTYCDLHSRLRRSQGILLALPEHILSFKLSGLQRLSEGRYEESTMMIKAQEWLDKNCRDVLDECDVSLAIKTQLIYPSGSQITVDGHPLRWQVIETVLRLVRSYLPALQFQLPQSIEVVSRSRDGYPLMYFLRTDVEERLITLLTSELCKGITSVLPFAEISAQGQADLEAFIGHPVVATEIVTRVETMFKDNSLMSIVYLLRGLIVHRILLSTLKKRWNVQYGIHPDRDPIAVPYLAKGVPSPSAEWGHPDVTLILTCLSFYYEGLSIAQFKQAFEALLKSNEPSIEYEKWDTGDLPEGFRDYNAINVEDSAQLRELHHYVRFNAFTLDFYMNNFVFPRHAKQFSTKLQASGWDLVLYNPTRRSNCRTTGFSGTNDSRHQLPMMVKQADLPKLKHTNAEVLAYLLEPRNRKYVHTVDRFGRRHSETNLLRVLKEKGLRVLIDAGAQILEHDNQALATAWLLLDTEAAAAVYFDSDHKPCVLYKGGKKKIPLVASPFAENFERCLVYIDESHCRGTDLKLHPSARAALTLGPHLTKDSLVQAAMRLRLLGQTQSVTFFSPPEVHQAILDLHDGSMYDQNRQLDSSDVIRWLLEQSCNAIEQLEPLHFSQGNDYLRRTQAKLDNPDSQQDETQRNRYVSVLQCHESTTLKQLYEPKYAQRRKESKTNFVASLQDFATSLKQRRKDFRDQGSAVHSSALEEVEQEREIENEVEDVREVQVPIHFTPLKPSILHQDIEEFATTGRLPADSDAFEPMFCTLQKTALGISQGSLTAANKVSRLFVSTQFSRTVRLPANEPNDNFLRPVHYLMWSCLAGVCLIVSPEEADLLIPILRSSLCPEVHLIIYEAPVTRRGCQNFNNLDYYAVPPLSVKFRAPDWLKIELGIFAGRLYFDWTEKAVILEYLGLSAGGDQTEFTVPTGQEAFAKKPLTFLHEWLAVRRKGQDFEHTPIGFLTTGKPLSPDHPFFLSATTGESEMEAKLYKPPVQVEEESDDDDDHEDYFTVERPLDGDDEKPIEDDSDEENIFHDAGVYLEGEAQEKVVKKE